MGRPGSSTGGGRSRPERVVRRRITVEGSATSSFAEMTWVDVLGPAGDGVRGGMEAPGRARGPRPSADGRLWTG